MAERGRITPAGEPVSRRVLLRKGIVLEVLTILWNVVEAGVALVAGALAGSIALVGLAWTR